MYSAAPPTTLLPGVDPVQAQIDQQKEAERHRLVSQHLNQSLSHAASGSPRLQASAGYSSSPAMGATSPRYSAPVGGSPYAQRPASYGGYDERPPISTTSPRTALGSPTYLGGSPHMGHSAMSQASGLPGADVHRGQAEQMKEAERHRHISQHLNTQLSGRAGSVGGIGSPQYQQTASPHSHLPGTRTSTAYPASPPPAAPLGSSRLSHSPYTGAGAGSPMGHGVGGSPYSAAMGHGVGGSPYGAAHHAGSPHAPPMGATGSPRLQGASHLPGVDPVQGQLEVEREAERHRYISQHLNTQLQSASPRLGGSTIGAGSPHVGAGSPHIGAATHHVGMGSPHLAGSSLAHTGSPYAKTGSPYLGASQAPYGSPSYSSAHLDHRSGMHGSPSMGMGRVDPSMSMGRVDPSMLPGANPALGAAEQHKEAERHRLVSQHLNTTLQARSPHASPSYGGMR